jgi:hypothetical protein
MGTTGTILISVGGMVLLFGLYYYYYNKDKKSIAQEQKKIVAKTSQSLQLQAYERLVILAERISIPSLISRLNQSGINKSDMQALLTQTIKQEFDHNLSQQIYVSTEAWEAIRNLKEQNIHLINQMATILPAESSGLELNKKLLDFVVHQQNGSMHSMVQEALSFEAKKILK